MKTIHPKIKQVLLAGKYDWFAMGRFTYIYYVVPRINRNIRRFYDIFSETYMVNNNEVAKNYTMEKKRLAQIATEGP